MRDHSKRFSFLVLAAALLQPAGCGPASNPAAPTQNANTDVQPSGKAAPPLDKAEPPPKSQDSPIKISAEALAKECAADAKAAGAKYNGKTLEVEGKVQEANKVVVKGDIMLDGGKKSPMDILPFLVRCDTLPDYREKAPWLSKGQKVRVVGQCFRCDNDMVILDKCGFTELEPSPTPTVTAQHLTEEFAKDQEAANVKYYGKYGKEIVVEGAVGALEAKDKFYIVKLEGTPPNSVSCAVSEEEYKSLKKGDAVTIKGVCDGYHKEDKYVGIDTAFLLKKK